MPHELGALAMRIGIAATLGRPLAGSESQNGHLTPTGL
jgi:hypothetical protein